MQVSKEVGECISWWNWKSYAEF